MTELNDRVVVLGQVYPVPAMVRTEIDRLRSENDRTSAIVKELGTARRELTGALTESVRLQGGLAEANRRANSAEVAHAEFQRRVRDKAIEVAERQGWCVDGLNEALEELGLDRVEQEYTVKVVVSQIVDVVVNAATEDQAESQVNAIPIGDLVRKTVGANWEMAIDDVLPPD